MTRTSALLALTLLASTAALADPPALDERPAREGEWGYHPADGSVSAVSPPSFSWRPQGGRRWELQCSGDAAFGKVTYSRAGLYLNVHCPPTAFPAGEYFWRYRGRDRKGNPTGWSKVRRFEIPTDAVAMPLPPRAELMARIPKTHPRLFLRPENLGHLREQAAGARKAEFERLLNSCRKTLARPPDLTEPPKYPKGTIRGSDPWREIWWGNRKRVIAALESAANLAFAHALGGPEEYGLAAKQILLTCAKWDPRGSTGYRYNDEAGMPYAYHFSRTYTFVHDLLLESERQSCRRVMKVRGEEMYEHLYPRHFWNPFNSHANRAWHFLGEVGIAFLGEIEGAENWVWFAANVFMNTYPVWSDDDGGWHEGVNYWQSYQGRFTWWADVMREALGIDAYRKPYFSQAGYYGMYLMPPGKRGGGFGDLTARTTSARLVPLMTAYAQQAKNPHWQWWVEQCGGPKTVGGFVGFLRGASQVASAPPTDLPTSRLFRGTGQAVLNSDLTNAGNSVQVVLKSSPFGTQSHGYEANNSFLLWAYGKRLLIRSGYRDTYGSAHHRNWMWSAKSTNCITANGRGLQPRHSAKARGEIVRFETTPGMDLIVGQAGGHRRAILFFKPDLVLVYDQVRIKAPADVAYHLHALNRFELPDRRRAVVLNGEVSCEITFLHPPGLSLAQTDQYAPNPRSRIKLREWHLTATPGEKSDTVEFVAAYHPFREGEDRPYRFAVEKEHEGRVVFAKRRGETCAALLPRSTGRSIRMRREWADGSVEEIGKE